MTPARRRPITRRAGRTIWAVLGFLLLFAGLLVVVSRMYLIPALSAYPHVSRSAQREMSAHALLILALVLVILFCGLILTFGFGRFFFPRPTQKRTETPYVDAWAEAGRRAELEAKPEEFTLEDGDDEDEEGEEWKKGKSD